MKAIELLSESAISEAADFLKLKISTLYEKTSTKMIPHFKRGNKLYFHRGDLEAWLRDGKVKTQKNFKVRQPHLYDKWILFIAPKFYL